MASYNKVILLGNLTRDPELRYTPNQTAVVEFGLATNRRWTGQDGQQREETCFVDCHMFGKRAEALNKYLRKGHPIFVEGRLTYDQWQAQDGSRRSKLRVTIEDFQFISVGQRSGGGGGGTSSGGGGYRGAPPMEAPEDQADDSYGSPVDDIPF
ncbi:MAG TPA: single-stranded DNA-binding protein [Anaerohalosphaeraceae bacterium]|jgi:single-strand DNA-binding protein|nr:single-stranded DNA-binding protein [Anaerohalosphaeraceae bacterium]HRT49006.1 single-stranded DNA-binding protein [Anaerohalosphaeraceae bacterium]HRT85129.1 single-stranded DNA-binding protein [Anaerohalosphaeraceae bacterium]